MSLIDSKFTKSVSFLKFAPLETSILIASLIYCENLDQIYWTSWLGDLKNA